jgi:hypothetical protein
MSTGPDGERSRCPFCAFLEEFGEAGEHLLNAKKEILLAIRAIVEHEIERASESMSARGKGRRAKKVEID